MIALLQTEAGPLAVVHLDRQRVHRVGYAPDPWAWTPWEYSDHGAFSGRWDDPDGLWRSLYVANSRLTCFLEVLAPLRPDPVVAEQIAGITVDPSDAALYPTVRAGTLTQAWLRSRVVGEATISGWYAHPGHKESLPTLRQRFQTLAVQLRLPDVDAAAIRLARPRQFTQAIAGWLYQQTAPDRSPLAGVQYECRHGDHLLLWAIFERPGDGNTSSNLTDTVDMAINVDDPDLREAMRLHRISWAAPF